MLHETIRSDDFFAQHSVAILLRYCFKGLPHCSNIVKLCCAKNRRCQSSRVKSPLHGLVQYVSRVLILAILVTRFVAGFYFRHYNRRICKKGVKFYDLSVLDFIIFFKTSELFKVCR